MNKEALQIISLNDPTFFGLKEHLLDVGDVILEVEGKRTVDQLDFHFLRSENGLSRLKVQKPTGEVRDIHVEPETLEALDIRFSPMRFKICRNNCPFCFVHQMPKGLRESLYVKDEDIRLSFLYGNFTTMTDITDEEINKIIMQNLQPQYVSVHAVDPDVREKVFGRPMKKNILDTLKTLTRNGIVIHAQVVLCPGLNDGHHLHRTIETLEALDRNVQSMSVVPVGLTRHREHLPRIRRYDVTEYSAVMETVESYQQQFLSSRRKSRFVFLSDEWYMAAGRPLPEDAHYEGFPQIDNGVGLTRDFLTEIEDDIRSYGIPERLGSLSLVTGELGARVFNEYVFPLFEASGVKELPRVVVVQNRFFGDTVTVSGLLTSEDIISALRENGNAQAVLLPSNIVNYEYRFLDGPGIEEIKDSLGCPAILCEDSLVQSIHDWFEEGGIDA